MKNKSQVFVWTLYDFANSSYAVIIVAFVFAVFFTDVICSKQPVGDFYWSLGINISMIISAVLNPVCGALADRTSNKKFFLFLFTLLCVVPTGLMYFTGQGTVLFGLILFIVSNIGFQTSLTFYDAFISDMVEEKDYNRVSSLGYAVGYAGSLVSVLMVFPLKDNYPLLFALTALFYAVFSVPAFIFLKEKKTERSAEKINYFSYGFKKVADTLKHVNKFRNLRNFLLSYFLYIDSVNTIIFFSGIYAVKTLNFSTVELAVFFIIVQITAMIGSLVFAKIGNSFGIKRSIVVNILFWIVILVFIFFFVDETSYLEIGGAKIHYFFIAGGFAGTFLGSTQSLSRALMTELAPFEIKTEMFGFYALFEKTSTLIGPLTFGLVSWLTGSQKIAIFSITVFFILGLWMLKFVKEEKSGNAVAG
ncbi:MAG TPA: MFS transporter [Ignavibacteria bacterium]|nr:MFS transporter [Ignavibacteria bacterium]